MPAHTQLIQSRSEPLFNAAGPLIQFLVEPEQAADAFAIMRIVMRPGVAFPLHCHADPVAIYVLGGELDFLQYDGQSSRWRTAHMGDIICIPGDVKHALRNSSAAPVAVLIATTPHMHGFFRDLGTPVHSEQPTGPTSQDMQPLLTLAAKHNYWIASARENAAVGLTFRAREPYAYQTW
jgi:quercetin dioxygenase-like cupin family protein